MKATQIHGGTYSPPRQAQSKTFLILHIPKAAPAPTTAPTTVLNSWPACSMMGSSRALEAVRIRSFSYSASQNLHILLPPPSPSPHLVSFILTPPLPPHVPHSTLHNLISYYLASPLPAYNCTHITLHLNPHHLTPVSLHSPRLCHPIPASLTPSSTPIIHIIFYFTFIFPPTTPGHTTPKPFSHLVQHGAYHTHTLPTSTFDSRSASALKSHPPRLWSSGGPT